VDFMPYEVVVETEAYRIYWQDEARSVCVIQSLTRRWTWDHALVAVEALDATVRSVAHGVYVVYLFEMGKNMMPRGGGTVNNLQRLMSHYAPNTLMILFVRPDPSLRVFADVVTKTFRMLNRNYRFLSSIEDAQALITAHRQAQA